MWVVRTNLCQPQDMRSDQCLRILVVHRKLVINPAYTIQLLESHLSLSNIQNVLSVDVSKGGMNGCIVTFRAVGHGR